MKKYTVILLMLLMLFSLNATDYYYSNSTADGEFTTADKVLQPVSLNLQSTDGTSYFELGFKQDGSISNQAVSLEIGNDNVARGQVNVYWNISSSDSYTVKLSKDEALSTEIVATGGGSNSIDWEISTIDDQIIGGEGSVSYGTENAHNVTSSEGNAFSTNKNETGTTYYIYTETLDNEAGYVAGSYDANLVLTITEGGN